MRIKQFIAFIIIMSFSAFVYAVPPAPTPAKQSKTDTTNFGGSLSSADDTVQKALDTLDDGSAVGGLPVDTALSGDDGKYLVVDWGNSKIDYGTPAGGGDMTEAVWDGDANGYIDADAGGTNSDTSSATGVATVAAGTWSVIATTTHELGGLEANVAAYTGLVGISAGTTAEIDTAVELESYAGLGAFFNEYADDPDAATMISTLGVYSTSAADAAFQAIDATLTSIATLGTAADKLAYTTGVDTWAETALTAAGRAIIDDADASAQRTTLGLVIGTNVQAQDAQLQNIADDTYAQGDIIYFDGSNLVNLGPGVDGQYLQTQGAAANPQWASAGVSGDIEDVGDCSSGACFTVDGAGYNLWFEGATPNGFEILLTSVDPTGGATITLPQVTGTVVLGPAAYGTDNRITKTNGTVNLTQITGITVDDSNNISGVGTFGSGAITSSSSITSGSSFIIGVADVNQTELGIIDGATILTADLNIIDGIGDSGSLTAAELLHVDGVASPIQAQLDARALESIVGTSLNADDLTNSAGVLELTPEIPHSDAALNISGVWEIQDDTLFNFGNDADFGIRYDETTDDQLEIVSNSATDTTIDIANAGAGDANLVINGDITYSGQLVYGGGGDEFITMVPISAWSPSGSGVGLLAFEGSAAPFTLNFWDGSAENVVVHNGSTVAWDGTTHSFAAVTNFVLPTNAADASGEISISTGNQLKWHDGTKTVSIDTTVTTDNYVLKYDNATATFNLEADETGGSPAWSTVADPNGDVNIIHNAGEETQFTFTGDFTTGNQFNIEQLTGNPSGGVLFQLKAADSNVTLAQMGDGTNYTQISQAGNMTFAGTAAITLPNDTVTMAMLDDDGNFVDWTGNWTFGTGTFTLADGFTDGTMTLDGTGGLSGVSTIAMTGALSGVTAITASSYVQGLVMTTLDTAATVDLTGSTAAHGEVRVNEYTDDDIIKYILPPAAIGLTVCFYDDSTNGQIISIDPDDVTDFISNAGTDLAAGNELDSAGNRGDFVCMLAITADKWVTMGMSGTWVDGGAS